MDEQAHIAWGSAAKAIDCLPNIADDPQSLSGASNFAQEQTARAIHILVLIDQHMGVGLADGCSDAWVCPQQEHRSKDEIAEIEQMMLFKILLITGVDARHLQGLLCGFLFLLVRRILEHLLRKREIVCGPNEFILGARDGV